MPTRKQITEAIHQATGNPTTGAVAEWTPAIIDAVDNLCNPPAPETKTKIKTNQETRIMAEGDTPGGGSA
jgi:hypothetical protein